MAKIEPLAKFILSFEGGFVNDPKDHGGATNKGVTIGTWRQQGYDKNGDGRIDVKDLRLISDADATEILRRCYWRRCRADEIKDQSIANLLVDWLWISGTPAVTITQALLGVPADGIMGKNTLDVLNRPTPEAFFSRLKARRTLYYDRLVTSKPSQRRFINGWLNRLDGIRYGSLVDNRGREITW